MVEQILLSSGSFAGMRETGGFGQPLHALYPQIRAVLASELGAEAAALLAEPVVDRANNRIDWYTEGDPDHPPAALSDLPEEQRQPLLVRIHDLLAHGREVAERYAASGDSRRTQLGAMLRAALATPAEPEGFLVEGRLVIIRWGFIPDRPWETGGEPARSPLVPPPPPQSVEPPRDVTMPEIAMPELAAAAPESATADRLPPESGRQLETPPVRPTPEPIPDEPLPEAPPLLPPTPALSPAVRKAPPESGPAAATPDSSLEPQSEAGDRWRYAVVGSRYFWGVFALAALLAVIAVVWRGLGQPSLPSTLGEKPGLSPDADLERALARAQHAEAELRTRLESLLAQLAGRRGRCPSPAARADAAVPAATETPTPSARAMPTTIPSPASAGSSPDKTSPPPSTPESRLPLGTKSPERTLEDVLAERAPAVAGSARQPPRGQAEPPVETDPKLAQVKPPVKAEPTPEERREFASRLSAAGAATGEITATLLWNSPGDLDLVVRCPSGEQLDYRNPAACGGALDVDANAARASLSDRPVENAFWPAGRAAPGSYEIAVRYAPRKDEQNPRETPFQVRLIRGGQESVFKGAIRPNTVTPVTTFSVER